MAATTHAEFGADTEALEVAKAFNTGIAGKTILITGVNRGGIGFSTSQALASQSPAQLIIAGRTPAKVKDCIEALKEEFPNVDYRALHVDLSSQQSVRAAAAEVLSWSDVPKLNLLLNSAGVMGIQERTLTQDGIEMHFGTNHIGHWLFTCLIMPKLISAATSSSTGATRIVNVSSASPIVSGIRWSDMNFDKKNKDLPQAEQPKYEWFKRWGYENVEDTSYNPLDGYNRSKVANVLFGIGVNRRLFDKFGIVSLAVHPGVIQTELGRSFPPETFEAIKKMSEDGVFSFKSLGAGASTSLVAALDPKLGQSLGETKNGSENYGAYLIDCQISEQADPRAVSSQEAEKLWELSENLVGQDFAW